MKYYLIVGEASGDLHASNLMKAIRREDPQAEFRFYGGDLMSAVENSRMVQHYKQMAYMGFVPVMMHLPTILKNMTSCKKDIVAWNPDVLILVDYPGFNLDIARYIKRHTKIPIYYYISPKIWAWKEHRIKNIRRDVDRLFSILPFEVEFYHKHQYEVTYVGNPCVDAVMEFKKGPYGKETFEDFTNTFGLSRKPIVALLAGSRRQEIKDNLRVMIETARQFPDHQFVIARVPTIEESFYHRYMPENVDVKMVVDCTYRLLQQSDAALVTSGTATLETALLNIPQTVCYYIPCGKLMKVLKSIVLNVKYISLVNLIADRQIVTELIGHEMNVIQLSKELRQIIRGGSKRKTLLADYEVMRQRLGEPGASLRTAHEIVTNLIG